MINLPRLAAVVCIYLLALFAWEVFGGVVTERTSAEAARLTTGVEELWGHPLAQKDPDVQFEWTTPREVKVNEHTDVVLDEHATPISPEQSELAVGLDLDQRLKGLIWYSLYGVTFDGAWSYTSVNEVKGSLSLCLALPDAQAMYDDFRFELDGQDVSPRLGSGPRGRCATLPLEAGKKTIKLHIHYRTRGLGEFAYVPANANSLSRFHLRTTTNFDSIDYPAGATSPTAKARVGTGWALDWSFAQVLSGKPMGVVMPSHIQPGKLAADLSFSAPVSLLFFFVILLALAAIRGLDIHPVNYFGIACAFFAFQLLFAYSVDHLPLWLAFTLSSAASIGLVVSYLRLVVDARFALREAALAQLVYQVGFALAHFWEGYTGLTLSIMATLTLFLVMQLTGRIRWTTLLARPANTTAAKRIDSTPATTS